MHSSRNTTTRWLLAVAVAALSILTFWPGVTGGFLFDDYHNIVENTSLHLRELSPTGLWNAANSFSGGTRQLAMLGFAFNHYMGGLEPWGYKATGVLAHGINAFLVYWLTMQLLASSDGITQKYRAWASAGIALTWAVHPLQVSSALYVVQRMELLCFTFLLIALLLYVRARRQQIDTGHVDKLAWFGVFASWAIAFLFKESAALLPLFTLALELTILKFDSSSTVQRVWLRRIYLLSCVVALLVFIAWALPHYYASEATRGRDFNTVERLLTQCRVLVTHLKQMIYPVPSSMTFYYDDMVKSTGITEPLTTLLSAIFLIALFVLALVLRKRSPLVALGILLFFASHFLTSNIIPLEMMFEHRNYFALFGIVLASAIAIRTLVRSTLDPKMATLVIVALIGTTAGLGFIRASLWANPLLLATDLVQNNPDSARARMDLGAAYYDLSGGNPNGPFYHFAADQFVHVTTMPNTTGQAFVNLILMKSGGGLPPDAPDISIIWTRYLEHLSKSRFDVETSTSVWALLTQRQKGGSLDDGKLQEALELTFKRQEQLDYRYANAADYYLNIVGDNEKAEAHYAKAIEIAKRGNHMALIGSIIEDLLSSGHEELVGRLVDIQT